MFSTRDDHLDATEPKVGEAPFGEKPQRLCRDAATALGLDDSTAEFADVVLLQVEHHFTEIGVVVGRSNHEVEHLAGDAPLLEELGHLRGVGGGKRLDPRLARWVRERGGAIEVVRPERTQRECRAAQRGIRIRDGYIDGHMVEKSAPEDLRPRVRCGVVGYVACCPELLVDRSREVSR